MVRTITPRLDRKVQKFASSTCQAMNTSGSVQTVLSRVIMRGNSQRISLQTTETEFEAARICFKELGEKKTSQTFKLVYQIVKEHMHRIKANVHTPSTLTQSQLLTTNHLQGPLCSTFPLQCQDNHSRSQQF